MDCAEAKSKMEPYASDRLAAEEKVGLEQHLAGCEGCRLEVELVRAMGSAAPKSPGADGDEWTIDRIFGAGASRAPEAVPTAPPSATTIPPAPSTPSSAPATPEAEAPSSFAPEPLAPPPPPAPSGPDPGGVPVADAPVADAPPASADSDFDTASLFEKTPTPPPPEPVREEAPAPPFGAVPPDSETSFADLQLESIQSSSIAAPSGPGAGEPPGGAAERPPDRGRSKAVAAKAAKLEQTSWDFEPADARPDTAPPEGSLFFAEEALTRQAAARKGRNSTLRTALWAAGSVVGLALLVLSLWIAAGMRRSSHAPPPVSARPSPPVGGEAAPPTTPPAAPATQSAPAGDAGTEGASPPDAGASAPAAPGAARVIEAGALPTPPAAISPTRSGSATANTAPAPAKGAAAPPVAASKPPAGGKTVPASPAPRQAASPPPKPAVTRLERSLPLGGAPEPVEAEPAVTRTEPAPGAETPPPASAPAPAAGPAPSSTRDGAAGAPEDSGPASGASSPAPASPPAASGAPPEPTVERPIDRLHIATVNAAQNSDLDALRKLRDTWKGLVRSSVGPDRSRGKRELADCLWDIQSLTGKDSDKKEALLAYREYVLTAPAGGADARTVGRMRQLEDAMAESR